jgi:hypothetical protein
MSRPIYETVVTTVSADGTPHIAPMGLRVDAERVLLMPFKPSTTLANVLATGHAVMNMLTDVRVFAGCVTGRRDWPLQAADTIGGVRLAGALAHRELALEQHVDDTERPVLVMRVVHQAVHAPFPGFVRAQAAVIEGAVLVSRLDLLPPEKIDAEMAYLQIAIDKTAGPAELQAWQWLQQAVEAHRRAR